MAGHFLKYRPSPGKLGTENSPEYFGESVTRMERWRIICILELCKVLKVNQDLTFPTEIIQQHSI